jgi:signal transduction histidine kinase
MLAAGGALVRFTRRSQRLADLQMEFVAGVSHELRTPLSVIRTAAHNIGRGVVSDAEHVREYGSLIAREADTLGGMVEQILGFASLEAGRPNYTSEAVDIERLIDGAVASSGRVLTDFGCEIQRSVEPSLPLIHGDPAALKQVLQNLLTNAAKYGGNEGPIEVSACRRGNGSAAEVEIRVADHGPGIPPEELGQIFDPFFRGKRAIADQIHGTGLGLSLVRKIMEAHGGSIAAESGLPRGTTFILRLPLQTQEAPS